MNVPTSCSLRSISTESAALSRPLFPQPGSPVGVAGATVKRPYRSIFELLPRMVRFRASIVEAPEHLVNSSGAAVGLITRMLARRRAARQVRSFLDSVAKVVLPKVSKILRATGAVFV